MKSCARRPSCSAAIAAAASADRQTLRPARRLLGGRDLGDRRQRDDQHRRRAGRWRRCSAAASPPTDAPVASAPAPAPEPAAEAAPAAPPQRVRAPEAASSPAPPPVAGTGAREPEPAPEPEEEADADDAGRSRRPKRAGSSTSSSSPWPAPATTAAFGDRVADALPGGDPAPAGRAAERLLAARHGRPAELDRRDQRPAAERRDQADCPTYDEFRRAKANSNGVVTARLRLPGRNADPRRPARPSASFTWRAYMEGMADPRPASPTTASTPTRTKPRRPAAGGYAARLNPFVYFHSLLDLGDCSANDVPLDRARART